MVTGRDSPLTLNAELFAVAAVTVTLVPLAVRFPDAVPLVPTATLPIASVVGATLSVPTAALPVPDSETVTVGLEAFEVTVATALKLPAALGENMTLTGVLCPAVSVIGMLGAVSEKYWVEIATLLIVTDVVPELVAVADTVLLLPGAIVPKFNVADDRESEPGCDWFEEPELRPWQPVSKARPAKRLNAQSTLPRCIGGRLIPLILALVVRLR